MTTSSPLTKSLAIAICAVAGACTGILIGADDAKDPIKQVMQAYHKAPQGVDPVCKKAVEGKATPDELKQLVTGYKTMAAAKPPKGDEASWKEKTTKLLAAAQGLQKGGPDATAKYKEALNCKSCHTAHKPDK